MFDRQRAVEQQKWVSFFFSSAHTSLSSVFYRKNNVRQGACEKQMLSAGCGVATLDMYMNYNKPKTSPEESHRDRIIQHHSYRQKEQTLKTYCTEICSFQRKRQFIEKGNKYFYNISKKKNVWVWKQYTLLFNIQYNSKAWGQYFFFY